MHRQFKLYDERVRANYVPPWAPPLGETSPPHWPRRQREWAGPKGPFTKTSSVRVPTRARLQRSCCREKEVPRQKANGPTGRSAVNISNTAGASGRRSVTAGDFFGGRGGRGGTLNTGSPESFTPANPLNLARKSEWTNPAEPLPTAAVVSPDRGRP